MPQVVQSWSTSHDVSDAHLQNVVNAILIAAVSHFLGLKDLRHGVVSMMCTAMFTK
jgi:hypothetical protein